MEQRFQTSEGHSLLPYLSWNKIRCARTLCVWRNILESRLFPISLTPHLHSGGEGPKSWLVGLEGETVLTSPTVSLRRAAFASNALRFPEPWGDIEVKVLSSWRSAVVQSCPWLMGSISQILRHSSSSLAARYIISNINHTDDSSLFHMFHFRGSPSLNWLRI